MRNGEKRSKEWNFKEKNNINGTRLATKFFVQTRNVKFHPFEIKSHDLNDN